MTESKRVIIDTDPGIDDAAAIFLALSSELLQVEALTTVFGNVELEQCTRNALTILELAGREDIPVYQGAARPMSREPHYAKHIHGDDGLGGMSIAPTAGVASPGGAVDAIVSRVREAPGEITLIALGPLTNVAQALTVEPALAANLRELIVMGGAVLTWGNVTPAASANMYNDPEAADIVFRSGASIVQVGLDVCRPTVITHDHLARIRAAGTRPSRFLVDASAFIENAYRQFRRGTNNGTGVHFNDVPAVAYVMHPELFSTEDLYVEIETEGRITAGATVADFEGILGTPNARVCLGVESMGVADLLADGLASWSVG
ncbi:MAG: nucleoside hydrolase [Actinomycetota bacterium]